MSSDSEYEYSSDDIVDYYDDDTDYEEDLYQSQIQRTQQEMSKLYQLMF